MNVFACSHGFNQVSLHFVHTGLCLCLTTYLYAMSKCAEKLNTKCHVPIIRGRRKGGEGRRLVMWYVDVCVLWSWIVGLLEVSWYGTLTTGGFAPGDHSDLLVVTAHGFKSITCSEC